MKKYLLAIVCALSLGVTSASAVENEPEPGISFIGQFGMNISNVTGSLMDTYAKAGFNLGMRAEYVLPNCHGTYVNAGVLYSLKGYKYDGGIAPADFTQIARPCYIEIPVHVGYRYNINDLIGVYADLGPYFAIGTNGRSKTDFAADALEDVSHAFFHKSNYGMQRFDCGFGFRVGAEYNQHYSLTLGFDWGITDMYTDDHRRDFYNNNGYELNQQKNFNTTLSFGYRF